MNIDLPDYGFGIGVLHILCAVPGRREPSGLAKAQFWNAVLANARQAGKDPFLFIGDLNTGLHLIDESGRTFVCADQFREMSDLGWIDLWRSFNSDTTEFTWYSKLRGGIRGNGFRLDHAFASSAFLPRISGCRYSHAERDAGISDHSILLVDLKKPLKE